MRIEGDEVVFSTGKVREANCGIIGLSPELDVFEGYDGGFFHTMTGEEWRDEKDRLTQPELEELADYMIGLWNKFKRSLK